MADQKEGDLSAAFGTPARAGLGSLLSRRTPAPADAPPTEEAKQPEPVTVPESVAVPKSYSNRSCVLRCDKRFAVREWQHFESVGLAHGFGSAAQRDSGRNDLSPGRNI